MSTRPKKGKTQQDVPKFEHPKSCLRRGNSGLGTFWTPLDAHSAHIARTDMGVLYHDGILVRYISFFLPNLL
jgi:hypothetical protein